MRYALASSLGLMLPLGAEPAGGPGPGKPPTAKGRLAFRDADLRTAIRETTGEPVGLVRYAAFSSDTPPRVAAIYSRGRGVGIYVAGPNGRGGRSVLRDEGVVLRAVVWSPDGQDLAVWDEVDQGQQEMSSHASRVWVLRSDGTRRYLVAERATRPQWSGDGQHILFWREEANDRDMRGTDGEAKWRLYTTTGPWQKPVVEPATPAALSGPVVPSPDGRLLAYWLRDRTGARHGDAVIVVEDLQAGTEKHFPMPESDPTSHQERVHAQRIVWSPDAGRLVASLSVPGDLTGVGPSHYLMDLVHGRYVELRERIDAVVRGVWPDITNRDVVQIQGMAWLPDRPAQLLLHVIAMPGGDLARPEERELPPKRRWVVYDLDAGRLEDAVGLGMPDDKESFHHTPVQVSPDGGYLWSPLAGTDRVFERIGNQ